MSTYNNLAIAEEIRKTAYGKGYYGNSLRVAKDFNFINSAERSILDSYLCGRTIEKGNVELLKIATKIQKLGY